jgi:hypothetical protein
MYFGLHFYLARLVILREYSYIPKIMSHSIHLGKNRSDASSFRRMFCLFLTKPEINICMKRLLLLRSFHFFAFCRFRTFVTL